MSLVYIHAINYEIMQNTEYLTINKMIRNVMFHIIFNILVAFLRGKKTIHLYGHTVIQHSCTKLRAVFEVVYGIESSEAPKFAVDLWVVVQCQGHCLKQ